MDSLDSPSLDAFDLSFGTLYSNSNSSTTFSKSFISLTKGHLEQGMWSLFCSGSGRTEPHTGQKRRSVEKLDTLLVSTAIMSIVKAICIQNQFLEQIITDP